MKNETTYELYMFLYDFEVHRIILHLFLLLNIVLGLCSVISAFYVMMYDLRIFFLLFVVKIITMFIYMYLDGLVPRGYLLYIITIFLNS